MNENSYFVVNKPCDDLFQPIVWFVYYNVQVFIYYAETPYKDLTEKIKHVIRVQSKDKTRGQVNTLGVHQLWHGHCRVVTFWHVLIRFSTQSLPAAYKQKDIS